MCHQCHSLGQSEKDRRVVRPYLYVLSSRPFCAMISNQVKMTMSAPHLGRLSNATRELSVPACQPSNHSSLGFSPVSCPHSVEVAVTAVDVRLFNNPTTGTTSPPSVHQAKTPNMEPEIPSACSLLLQPKGSRTETIAGLRKRRILWRTTLSRSLRCSTGIRNRSRRLRLVADCPPCTISNRTIVTILIEWVLGSIGALIVRQIVLGIRQRCSFFSVC